MSLILNGPSTNCPYSEVVTSQHVMIVIRAYRVNRKREKSPCTINQDSQHCFRKVSQEFNSPDSRVCITNWAQPVDQEKGRTKTAHHYLRPNNDTSTRCAKTHHTSPVPKRPFATHGKSFHDSWCNRGHARLPFHGEHNSSLDSALHHLTKVCIIQMDYPRSQGVNSTLW